jgi:stage V sporulation protein R
MFINTFVDQDFVDAYKLFVAGKRLNRQKGVWEYFVESRDAAQYRQMLLDSLYHPPFIVVDKQKSENGCLYLNHHFEEKPLIKEFIHNTMLGIEYLWGGSVKLETTEMVENSRNQTSSATYYTTYGGEEEQASEKEPQYVRVVYTMEKRQLSRSVLS